METFMGKLEKKEDTRGTRIEAAQRLTKLAGIIAQGRADILGRDVVLGDQVESCWSVTVRDGFIHYDLSLKIPLSETGDQKTCGIPPHPEEAATAMRGRSGAKGRKGKNSAKGRHGAKKHKKTTGALWKIVKKAVQDKRPIPDADASALMANLHQYDAFVKDEWRGQWDQCVKAAAGCVEAARSGDFKTAEVLLKEVNDRTKACHKKHK
jgi:hypothetical protein